MGPMVFFFIFVVIILLKLYFRGQQCLITKNLYGYTAIVTGANTGIGKATTLKLSQLGCEVIIASRNKKQSLELVKQIHRQIGNKKVQYMELDLSSKVNIQNFAAQIKKKFIKIDILINNAGVLASPKSTTDNGFDMQIGVNYLGHYYLTYLLWPLLKQSFDGRIINISSILYKTIKFQPIFQYRKELSHKQRYAQSKLSLILFSSYLAKKYTQSGLDNLRIVSLHPGIVNTRITRNLNKIFRFAINLFRPLLWIFLRDEKQGSQTVLYCALEKKQQIKNGAYYYNNKQEKLIQNICNLQNENKLWNLTLEALQIDWKI